MQTAGKTLCSRPTDNFTCVPATPHFSPRHPLPIEENMSMKRQHHERKDTPLCQESKLEPMKKNVFWSQSIPGVGSVLPVY